METVEAIQILTDAIEDLRKRVKELESKIKPYGVRSSLDLDKMEKKLDEALNNTNREELYNFLRGIKKD